MGLNDGDEFDATKTGPVCSQGTIDADNLDQLFSQQVSDIIAEAIDSVISETPIAKQTWSWTSFSPFRLTFHSQLMTF